MSIQWPSELNQYFNKQGFAYTDEGGVIRTEMQVGYAEARSLLSDSVWRVRGNIHIPTILFLTLVDFFENTLKNGTLRFQMVDPSAPSQKWLWRFKEPFALTAYGGEMLTVFLDLERIPGTLSVNDSPLISSSDISKKKKLLVDPTTQPSVFNQYVIAAGDIQWPDELSSCYLQEGFMYGPVKATINSKMGAGLGKSRRRFTLAPWKLRGGIFVDLNQRVLLDAFVKDSLDNGAFPFVKADPILPARSFKWRLEEPLSYSPRYGGLWQVMLSLSRLPVTPVLVSAFDTASGLVDDSTAHLTNDVSSWLAA